MNRRLWIFLLVFVFMNLAFIPLMATYGLRVCPILSVAGFWFGCAYVGTFIFLVSAFNIILVSTLGKYPQRWRLQERALFIYAGFYFFATLVAMLVLEAMLHINHMTGSSRAPEILALASLLLGITQSYGLGWVYQKNSQIPQKPNPEINFRRLWIFHSFRTLLPILTAFVVLIHFQISQSIDFNNGRTAIPVSHDQLIEQTSLVILFLLLWLAVTFTFHFLSEKQQASDVQKHLSELGTLNTEYRSGTTSTWGLWSALLNQLNNFSKTLDERTKLLKSFSRFVSADVAKQALKIELKHTVGITQDTTILISDIRNFTVLSEKLDPHQTVDLLNQYFTAMLDELVRFEVSVDKFIGDAILAYVETNIRQDDGAEKENRLAVAAAFSMLDRLEKLNISLSEQKLPTLSIGIGIYRGPVIIGLIGSEAKLQHTIIGDSVNRTARIESLCKDLGASILVSESVWFSLDTDLQSQLQHFGEHLVKGVHTPLVVYGKASENHRT